MKKLLLLTIILIAGHFAAKAQNSIFPLLNVKTSFGGHFIAAQVKANYNYLGKTILVADKLYYYKGADRHGEYTTNHGQYISFTYAANLMSVGDWNRNWNKCVTQTQFAFWPGNIDDYNLHGFVMSNSRLYLVELESDEIVAEFETANNPTAETYAYLTVFASEEIDEKDRIVICGKNGFNYYEEIPFSTKNSVNSTTRSTMLPKAYFDVSGKKFNAPMSGINIVVNDDESRKIVVK